MLASKVGLRSAIRTFSSSLVRGSSSASSVLRSAAEKSVPAAAASAPVGIARSYGPADLDRFAVEARDALKAGDTRHAYGLHPDAGAVGLPGVMGKLGWWPVAGLGLAALASKEVLILNEETLIVFTFSSFLGTSYLAMRDNVNTELKTAIDEIADEQYKAYDRLIDRLDECIKAEQRYANVVEETKNLQIEFQKLIDRVLAARQARFQTVVNQAIEERLTDIEKEEARFLDSYASRVTSGALSFARSSLSSANPRTKADIVDAVIAGLSGRKPERDPVKEVFLAYFNAQQKKYLEIKKKGLEPPNDAHKEMMKAKWSEFLQKIEDDKESVLKQVPMELREEYSKEYDRLRSEIASSVTKGKPLSEMMPKMPARIKFPY